MKVMSKMGISTYMSYCGAQIFEAVGLNKRAGRQVFHRHGVEHRRHRRVRSRRGSAAPAPRWPSATTRCWPNALDAGGEYAYRVRGEEHMWTPDAIAKLQHAARAEQLLDLQGIRAAHQRPVASPHDAARPVRVQARSGATPIPIEEVEPAKEIVKRFATGAMSLGSISTEAHATLAIAMNRIGGKSNTGEGGEDPQPLSQLDQSRARRSRRVIGARAWSKSTSRCRKATRCARRSSRSRRAASASPPSTWRRADQIQIKMAQGAKPGEGGQLPGHKVSEYIAQLRFSVPGVGLISPPPHHDIYSIEDLAQLIHDLKNANPQRVDLGEAGVRSRRRHGRRGRGEGQGRPRDDRRPRRRHRRVAAVVDQARRHAVGAGPRRDPADAGAEPPARPHRACRPTAR